uniref:osteocrin n=1 Tax=Pristiophorus japonicus TaxID=55135 RepID=UPI00398F66E7
MPGSGQIFFHILILLGFVGWIDGATSGTEAAEESSDPSPRAEAVLTPTSVEGNDSVPSVWLPLLSHLTGPHGDTAARKRKRTIPRSALRLSRSAIKPKILKAKQRKGPDVRRRRIDFPIDRIGRIYLPKILTSSMSRARLESADRQQHD